MNGFLRFRERISLRKQQLYLFMITAVLLTFIVIAISIQYYQTQRTNMLSYQELYADQVAHSARQAYEAYKNIAYSAAYNQLVQDYIEQEDSLQRYKAYQQAIRYLSGMQTINPNVLDITVYSPAGNSISLLTSPDIYRDYEEQMQSSGNTFASLGTLSLNGTTCHILSIPIHRLSASGQNQYLGNVLLAVNSDRFFHTSARLDIDTAAQLLLTDEKHQLIYGDPALFDGLNSETLPNENAESTVTIHQVTYLLRSYPINESGSMLCVLFDLNKALESTVHISLVMAVLLLIMLIIMIGSFLGVWIPVTNSLHELTRIMADVSANPAQEHFTIDPDNRSYSCSETSEIFHTFSHMMAENEHLHQVIMENYAQMMTLELNNRQTEIAFLRSQINPHFLYNTLTAICGMSADGMNEQVIDMTSSLASIFRYSIHGSEMVTLTEELAIVDAYLRIQSYRFEDRLSVTREIDSSTMHWMIPKMIIQPLIENAIVHGIEPSLAPCRLKLFAAREDDHLVIRIVDTGVGMDQDRLEEIRSALAASTRHQSPNASEHLRAMDELHHSGIGLLNVNSRLVLHYGSDYALVINSAVGEGTDLCIRIPVQPTEKGDQLCIRPSSSMMKNTSSKA